MIIEKKRLIYSHLNLKTKIKLICLFSTKNCKKKTNKKEVNLLMNLGIKQN